MYTSGIQEGIAYVLENKNLYTISNGVISEFEAKLKTVTEEKENNDGDANNTSVKLILSVSDSKYIVLSEDKIMMHKPIYINKSVEFGSEGASQEQGYRLYIDHLGSHLDVDYINVRSGLEATFSKGMIIMHCGNIPIPEELRDYEEDNYDRKSQSLSKSELRESYDYVLQCLSNAHEKLILAYRLSLSDVGSKKRCQNF